MVATADQISQAYWEGSEAYGKQGVSHVAGRLICPYDANKGEGDLVKAWCMGFDAAAARTQS